MYDNGLLRGSIAPHSAGKHTLTGRITLQGGNNVEKFFQKFVSEEKGAITVDWVVLVAGVLSLCAAIFGAVQTGTSDLTEGTGEYLEEYEPFDGA